MSEEKQVLATLLHTSNEQTPWLLLAITQEMIEKREQPLHIGPFEQAEERQALIAQHFPKAGIAMCLPHELRIYLSNCGYRDEELPVWTELES